MLSLKLVSVLFAIANLSLVQARRSESLLSHYQQGASSPRSDYPAVAEINLYESHLKNGKNKILGAPLRSRHHHKKRATKSKRQRSKRALLPVDSLPLDLSSLPVDTPDVPSTGELTKTVSDSTKRLPLKAGKQRLSKLARLDDVDKATTQLDKDLGLTPLADFATSPILGRRQLEEWTEDPLAVLGGLDTRRVDPRSWMDSQVCLLFAACLDFTHWSEQ